MRRKIPRKATEGRPTTFPKPDFHTVRDSPNAKRSIRLFEYWAALTDEAAQFAELRMYRMNPPVDNTLVGHKNKITDDDIIRGKIPFAPDDYEQYILHRWGSGTYHAYLNETGVPGSIMEAYMTVMDMENFPPKIDPNTIVRDHPDAQWYVDWCHRRGISLPWDEPEPEDKQEGDDMANASELVEKLVDQNMQLAREAGAKGVPIAAPPEPQADAVAQSRGIETIASASEIGFKMLDKQVDRIMQAAAPQFNPVEMLKESVTIFQSFQRPDSSPELMRMWMDNQKAEREAREKWEHQLIERLAPPKPEPGMALTPEVVKDPVDSMLESIEKYQRIQSLLGGNPRRREREPDEPPPPARKGFLEMLGEAVVQNPAILGTGLSLLTTFGLQMISAWRGTPMPTPPPQPVQAPPQQLPWPVSFVNQIAPAFAAHYLGENTDGYSLAEFVLSNGNGGDATTDGRRAYELAKEQLRPHKDDKGNLIFIFDQLLRRTPVWQQICDPSNPQLPAAPQKYMEFMQEFFSYDDWKRKQEDEVPTNASAA